ncbi:DASS family sodium-coupled anion symporter [Candidatus Binatia bacterium]|nr:DASS family sodium-coupled anion symporter [Candidatus Binatia bacterium]
MPTPPDIVIDTRPLWMVLVSRSLRPLLVAIGIGLYGLVLALPAPEGLSVAGQKALAIFALCVFYWVFDVLPLMVTGVLAIIMLPLTGVMPATKAYALFGNEAVFFILGVFILAACLMKSGLSTRLALTILRRFGKSPRMLLTSVLILNAVMSFLMSEHAVAAMNFPIVLEIVAVLGLRRGRSNYGKAMFLALAWGTTIGGVATMLGGARAPLAIGMLRESTGLSFSFAEWSVAILPLVVVLLAICYCVIVAFFPIDVEDVRAADAVLRAKSLALGRMRYTEGAIAGIMLITLAAWIVGGEEFGLANIALGAVVVLFVLGLVTWREVEGYVNWGVLLMYGGAISLGSAINQSGAAAWIAQVTITRWATSGTEVIAVLSLLGIVLTEAMSNSAVVALLMPVSLGIAAAYGMDPRVMALTIAVPAGLGYTLPIGTPANAIAYSSGHLTTRDMVVPGILLAVVSWITFNALANWYWPLIGLHITGSR